VELHPFPYLFLIPLFPLLGAVVNGLFGVRLQRALGKRAVHTVAVALPWASFVVAALAFATLTGLDGEAAVHQSLWPWFAIGPFRADMAFSMDRLSGVMTLIVTFVGSLIHVYSTGYMHDEESYWRFFAYLNLFMFAMLVLVLGDSFLTMFVGWEGVGLCSYLLISFWYKDSKNAAAGMKAFVVNRVGDAGFLIGLALLIWALFPENLAGLSFREVQEVVTNPAVRERLLGQEVFGVGLVSLICVLFFVGATGKSAQIPLYVWLPDAMAGPTPVSALIHAATMVTAGVYMVARLNFLFALSPAAMTIVATVGALTALFAATIGLFQYDIKKVLAYSTVSQLGFMFMAVGVGAHWVGIFHLMTHAFFKACLFLGAGSVIMGCHHEQDMRHMGGLGKLMPVTALTYLLACFAIAGFPFFAGFFSKDEILWKVFDSGNLLLPGGGKVLWVMGALAATCTSFYMFRSYYMTFSGSYRGHGHPHESPLSVTLVLSVLGFLSVVGGYVGLPLLWGLPNWFEHWLEPVFEPSAPFILSAGGTHGAEWALMIFSIGIALVGFLAARWLYKGAASPLPQKLLASTSPTVRFVHRLIFHKYYVDEAYQATVVDGSLRLSSLLYRFDQGVVDFIVNACGTVSRFFSDIQGWIDHHLVDGLVNGVATVMVTGGKALKQTQTGRIQSYVYGITAGAVALVVVAWWLA
jgi:NADH-quinone oxidoreductase subunit L